MPEQDHGPERCFVFIHNGLPGYLLHPRGIPRRKSKCPIGKWNRENSTEDRLEICRNCQHYRNDSDQ